jgi:hypothetical protein
MIDMAASGQGASLNSSTYLWAILYVPQGVITPTLNLVAGSGELVPNPSWLMAAGTFQDDQGHFRVSTPLSRKLDEGDTI